MRNKTNGYESMKTFDFKLGNAVVKAKIFEKGDEHGFTLVKIPMGGTREAPYVVNNAGDFLVAEKGFGKYFLVFHDDDTMLVERDSFEKDAGMKKAFEKNVFEGYLGKFSSSTGETFTYLPFNGMLSLYKDLGILAYESKFVAKEGQVPPIASIKRKGDVTQLIFNTTVKDDEYLESYAGAYLLYDILEGNLEDGGEISYYGKPELDDIRNKAFVIKWLGLESQYKKAKKDIKYRYVEMTNDILAETMRLPRNVVLELKLLYA